MKIKQIAHYPEEDCVKIEYEEGDELIFRGEEGKRLLQLTEMKVGEIYTITNDRAQVWDATVEKISENAVHFVNVGSAEHGFIPYADAKSYSFVKKKGVKQTTAKERVEKELSELSERCKKLASFMMTAEYDKLSAAQRYLMEKQLQAMEEYECILNARLSIW